MKYAFISGAQSGLAQAAIKKLTELGFTIFCADISYQENKKENNLYFIKMDITKDSDILSAFEFVCSITDKLDLIKSILSFI